MSDQNDYLRHEAKRRSHAAGGPSTAPKVVEFRNPENPWPDNPSIPDLSPYDPFEDDAEDPFGESSNHGPPSDEDIDDENSLMLRRQRLFRWAAQSIANALSELPEVEKVAAFGGAAQPLHMEVPRFREFRRYRIEVLHECADLDLAVWTTDLGRLQELQRAMKRGLSIVQDTPYSGVAHHQVDVHLFEAATSRYRGRLCIFRSCPKQGKRECLVPGCGEEPFLQQFADYRFRGAQFEAEPKVVLFERSRSFLVCMPGIEGRGRPRRGTEG